MTHPASPSTEQPHRRSRWLWLRRRSVWLGLAAVAALAIVAAWPRAVAVDLEEVAPGPLEVTLDAQGVTRVRQIFVITAPVPGKLRRIVIQPGDPVSRGETILASILPADPFPLDERAREEASAALQGALAVLARTRAEARRAAAAADHARAQFERIRPLHEGGLASSADLEARRTEAAAAEEAQRAADFAADAASHDVAMARARLRARPPEGGAAADGQGIEIRAPIDGVVLRRLRESEAVVGAGEPLLELGDPSRLEVVADYLSIDAVRIAPGQAATIERWGGASAVRARVRRVEPAGFTKVSALGIEEQRVNVLLDLVEPPAAFRAVGDRFRVETRVVVWSAPSVTRLPIAALFRQGDQWAVYRAAGGRARRSTVEIGERNDRWAEARGGIAPGDRVIVHPPEALRDGARIERRRQE